MPGKSIVGKFIDEFAATGISTSLSLSSPLRSFCLKLSLVDSLEVLETSMSKIFSSAFFY